MKKHRIFLLLLICTIHLLVHAENILKNPTMTKAAGNGLPVSWNVRNGGTWKAIENGFTLSAGSVAIQQMILPLDGELRLKAVITATKGLKYRLYAEYWTDKKPDGTGERWMNSGADWIEGTGEPQSFEKIFKVAFLYDHAHFAIMADKGEGTMECQYTALRYWRLRRRFGCGRGWPVDLQLDPDHEGHLPR